MSYVRREWIEACEFHPMEGQEVLREVANRARSARSPLILLDLDSTLYEVQPRTRQILEEWRESELSRAHPEVRLALGRLEPSHLGYSLTDTFGSLGLNLKDAGVRLAWQEAKAFWAERFFSDDYLKYDVAYPGAARFVRELASLGAGLVYLTGRDEPRMGRGTREKLASDGFPMPEGRTHLLLKPESQMDDLEHKRRAAHYLADHGTLVASFENEPLNLTMFQKNFPDAMHVFVDTVCSDNPASPCKGIYRIQGFE